MLLDTLELFSSPGPNSLTPGTSVWYKRQEAQKRYTFFFASTTLAGAFGGLLASAIGKMDGLSGYAGWRWIFILGTLPS
jgi:MFS family permease